MYNWGRAVIISISFIFILLCLPCSAYGVQIIYEDDFEHLLFNNRTNLTIPTYDGSGEAIHPDVYYNASGWNGYKYWMAMTPYPSCNNAYENPSIVVSNDSINWVVPTGLSNPIDPPPSGYNSDTNLAFKNNTLYCYYREDNGTHNILQMRNSTDGINWSPEYTSLALPNHQLVAPAVIYNCTDNLFYMWYIDSGTAGSSATTTWLLLRNSTDGINWGDAQNCTILIPDRVIWHANIEFIPEKNEYWLLVSAGTTDALEDNELFFAYSSNMLDWTVLPGKIIGLGRSGAWDDYYIYQSAIQYIDSKVKIWYTGYDSPNWHSGYVETTYADLKTDYKWNYMDGFRKACFELSTDQVKNGTYSGKYEHFGTSSSNILRNVSSDLGGNYTVNIDFYDDGDVSAMKLLRAKNATETVGLGVWTGSSSTNYIYHSTAYSYTITGITRSIGWHNFKIKIYTNSTAEFLIDDVSVGSLASQFSDLQFVILSGYLYNDVFYVDNLVVSTDVIPPIITNWNNSKTNNNSLVFTINTSEDVNFNVTSDQTITTWNWYKDDVDQSHNYDNITLNWSTSGLKHVVVNATNANGTSSSITWNVTVQAITPVVTFLSMTPSEICQNCTGNISICYGISHSSVGLNNTSVSFIYRDYDYDLSDSNHSIRPPTNDLASEWNFDGRILRGANRNESLNFENNATITGGDTYTWSGLDENNSEVSIVPVNSTYTKVYINSTVHRVMPQMHYIDRSQIQEAPKTTIAIHKHQDVLVKFWNFEIFKGNTDFLGVGYTDTALDSNPALWPSDSDLVNYYYISSGYDPATGGDPLTSGYAVYMGSLNASQWINHIHSPHANSSYVRGFINNTLLQSYINTTNISYVLYTSNTPQNKAFFINVTNIATTSNKSFANTNVLWAGDNAMSAEPYTPNIWFAFIKLNLSLDHKLFVADNNNNWANSTMNRSNITTGLFPPTKPSFYAFHNGFQDFDMNGTYHDTIQIQVSAGSDPDGGVVTHNITLHYGNKTYVATINGSAVAEDGVYTNITFNTTPYYSQTENYTLRVVATDDEGENVTVWLGFNFSLDGSPQIISYSPETPVSSSEGENQTFSITTNLLGNVTWYLDSVEVFNETSVNTSSYSNSTATFGTYNVTVTTTNTNGTNSMTWDWTVILPKKIPLSIFIMWSVIMCAGVIIGFMTTGLYGITSSLLTATIAYMNSKNIINGNVVQYFSGISTSDTIVVGYRTIESLPMSYIYLFIAIVMVIVFILQVKNEIQYNLEPDMDGEFFDE